MATKYSKKEVIKIIQDTAKSMGVDECFMIAKADIESSFNNLAKNGIYWGLFQLNNGVGGCKGDDRLDPKKNTVGAITYLLFNKKSFSKDFPGEWEDWMGYLCHQQGLYRFKRLYKNMDVKISDLNGKDQRAVVLNSRRAWGKIVTYRQFVDNWRKYFIQLTDLCHNACAMSDDLGDFLSESKAQDDESCSRENYVPQSSDFTPTPAEDDEPNGGNGGGNGGGKIDEVVTKHKRNFFIRK